MGGGLAEDGFSYGGSRRGEARAEMVHSVGKLVERNMYQYMDQTGYLGTVGVRCPTSETLEQMEIYVIL